MAQATADSIPTKKTTKSKATTSKVTASPKAEANTPATPDQIDKKICIGIRDTLSRDIMTPLFVNQIVRRFGITEDEAKTAIKARYDEIVGGLNLPE